MITPMTPLTQNRTSLSLGALLASSLLFGTACSEPIADSSTSDPSRDALQTSSLALTAQLAADSNVSGMTFVIDRVACNAQDTFDPMHYTHSGDLEDLNFPSEFVPDQPLATDSEHRFADHYVVLEAGCYSVEAVPSTDNGDPSTCSNAYDDMVLIKDGMTTEITLISQCEGEKTGGLDTAVVLNTAPRLTGVVYTPSKFVEACKPVEICASASDPDNDPLEFVFQGPNTPTFTVGPLIASSTRSQQCVTLTPMAPGAYEYQVSVYDLLENGDRYEAYYASIGQPQESRDTLTMPLYVQDTGNCP